MKLTSLSIENFKTIRELQVDFRDAEGDPRFLTAFLGDNGSGKTTVLQAVALTLELATGQINDINEFSWSGFVPERVESLGPTRVDLRVEFSDDELDATQEMFEGFRETRQKLAQGKVPPGRLREINLRFERGNVEAQEGPKALSQCRGRQYADWMIMSSFAERRSYMARVGGLFYFDQGRSLETAEAPRGRGEGVRELRKQLVGALSTRSRVPRPGDSDLIGDFEAQLARVFPGLQFDGAEPRNEGDFNPEEMFVYVKSPDRRFDISEMASGHQAVFPLLWQFVRNPIVRSIVLIDELELHLHPPQQQALLRALRNLGDDCQFLITTHSPFLEQMVPDEWEIRLPGGSLCL